MGVPRSKPPSPFSSSCSSSSSSSSPSPSSSFSSCFSSTQSTMSTHSITSSSNSTSISLPNSPTRCEGLDLLVKAIYHVVAGSVVGVPYIQRRVIRRRKRAIRFGSLVFGEAIKTEFVKRGEGEVGLEENCQVEGNLEGKTQTKRSRANVALPSKYHDSVLHQWKPPRSRQRRSGKVKAGSGLSSGS